MGASRAPMTPPINAAAAMTQRIGPANTSTSGTRSGSHGRYGTAHSHKRQTGTTAELRRAPTPVLRLQPIMRAEMASVVETSHTRRVRGASKATLDGLDADQFTMYTDAGTSQTATASASRPAVM